MRRGQDLRRQCARGQPELPVPPEGFLDTQTPGYHREGLWHLGTVAPSIRVAKWQKQVSLVGLWVPEYDLSSKPRISETQTAQLSDQQRGTFPISFILENRQRKTRTTEF